VVWVRQVFEPMFAQISQAHAIRQHVSHQVSRRPGDQNLPAVPGGADAGGPVDIHAHVAGLNGEGFARVQAHPDPQGQVLGPGMRPDSSLHGNPCSHRIARAGEGSKQSISLGIHLPTAPRLDGAANESPVVCQDLSVSFAQLLEKTCRSLDIGEEKSNRSGRQA
jgi:hypothetical protein